MQKLKPYRCEVCNRIATHKRVFSTENGNAIRIYTCCDHVPTKDTSGEIKIENRRCYRNGVGCAPIFQGRIGGISMCEFWKKFLAENAETKFWLPEVMPEDIVVKFFDAYCPCEKMHRFDTAEYQIMSGTEVCYILSRPFRRQLDEFWKLIYEREYFTGSDIWKFMIYP